jgi:pSer/pThr/pTyr-binding forkhead associated (FHA) protein
MIKIAVYYDSKLVKEVNYDGTTVREITIGRAPGCVLRLDEATVSRLHALIRWNDGAWVLERKASFGAVKVNGEEVENAVLQGGEEISVGKFSIRIQVEATEAAAPSEAQADPAVFHDEEGRTRAISGASAVGIFRIDPGMANTEQYLVQKDKVVFGRASNCDVVLLEKKASRKHFEVTRQGLTFYLKDLQSANGTLVNARKVDQVELNPGDEIRVGETLLKFSVENPDFFQKQDQFAPVSVDMEESLPMATEQYAVTTQGQQAVQTYGDSGGELKFKSEPEEKSLFKKYYKRYKALPVGKRYLVLLVVLAVILFIFDDEGEKKAPGKKSPAKKHALVKDPTTGKILRVYENLSKERQALVEKNYAELKEAYDKKDFGRVLERTTTILNFVDDYKETKFYESRAKQVVDQREREAADRLQRDRQQRIKEEVIALEQKGAEIYKKALEDPKYRPEVTNMVQEIYSKDPNNRLAQEWLDGLKDKDADDARKKEEEKRAAAIKKRGEEEFAAVEKKFTDGKYLDALASTDSLYGQEWSNKEFNKKVDDLKERINNKLSSMINPLMNEAEELRTKNTDLVKAKNLYIKVLNIDPKHEGAIRGLDAIRGVLHLQAKRLYAEAILAESVSDLAEAKEKFGRCEQAAPEGDVYKKRCQNKLQRYEAFSTTGGS